MKLSHNTKLAVGVVGGAVVAAVAYQAFWPRTGADAKVGDTFVTTLPLGNQQVQVKLRVTAAQPGNPNIFAQFVEQVGAPVAVDPTALALVKQAQIPYARAAIAKIHRPILNFV